ncbi:hypothetical protein EII34_06585 [Arachnia propionica]|uniref:Uncharacterized protein n=1 Tax=Arachnia propionica TaxID=1750 RepID=A0A3P1T884_9ACTN|nr:SdrD B-like domain-containing protein [Arachnia propionica]RRD05395.1 hypothetical protein EII34_06585 [Arachnia propionica]
MRLISHARGVRRMVAKAAVVLGAAAVSLAGVALPAQAADNPNIQFSDASLTKIDTSGNPVTDGSNLTLDDGNDRVRFDVSWALPKGSPLNAGDSFTVTLPKEFNSLQTTAGGLGTPELTVDLDGNGTPETVVGSCVIEPSSFTCTFTEEAAKLVGQGGAFENFSGNVSIQLRARATTTSEELPFTFSGQPRTINLDLPGEGGIKAAKPKKPYEFTPAHFAKGASGIGSGSTEISFVIGLSTSEASSHSLAFRAKQAGKALTFDGREQTLEFTDTIGSGLKFGEPSDWKLFFADSKATDTDAPDVPLASGDGAPTTSDKGTWTFSVRPGPEGPDGQVAKLAITGPFEADANYVLAYKGLPVDGGKLKPGVKYENVLTYDDADVSAKYSRSFAAAFTADVKMDPAFASFAVTKYVGGPGSSLVPQGTEFTVKASYELPTVGGTQQTVASYPGWQAPGTVNAARTGGEVTLTAKVGEKVTFTGPTAGKAFPAGTVVKLAELENPTAAPDGYLWESFTFTVNDQEVTTLTLGKGEVTSVDLTNRLKKAPVGKFSVIKKVEGLTGGATAPAEFTFHYACNDPAATEGDLKVPSNGTPAESPELPDGTRCTVTEKLDGAEVAGHRLTPATPQTLVVGANVDIEMVATNTYTRTLVSIGDLVWLDADRDGTQDDGEAPVPGVKVTLVDEQGKTIGETVTDAQGYYGFKDLAAGAGYKVILEAPEGHQWTVKDTDSNGADAKDSDVVQDAVKANLGTIEFTAPLDGRNELGVDKADDPTLDGGLVKVEAPSTPAPSTPAPSTPAPSVPAPSTPAPSAPAPSTPAPSTPAPSVPAPSTPAPSAPAPSTPVPSKPVPSKPVMPPVKPGLPKTGR